MYHIPKMLDKNKKIKKADEIYIKCPCKSGKRYTTFSHEAQISSLRVTLIALCKMQKSQC
jgi:hypothetical protein